MSAAGSLIILRVSVSPRENELVHAEARRCGEGVRP